MADIDTTTDDVASSGTSMKSKLLIGGAVVAVILFECILAYFLLPSADEIADAAKAKLAAQQHNTANSGEGAGGDVPVSEVELGDFYVTDHKVEANATWNIQFALWGVVATKDLSEFKELFRNNQNRWRDRIIATIRNSEASDLSDSGLGLIRRRILEKSNALFGKQILREVSFSNYRFRID